jgi:hypothetical protein
MRLPGLSLLVLAVALAGCATGDQPSPRRSTAGCDRTCDGRARPWRPPAGRGAPEHLGKKLPSPSTRASAKTHGG